MQRTIGETIFVQLCFLGIKRPRKDKRVGFQLRSLQFLWKQFPLALRHSQNEPNGKSFILLRNQPAPRRSRQGAHQNARSKEIPPVTYCRLAFSWLHSRDRFITTFLESTRRTCAASRSGLGSFSGRWQKLKQLCQVLNVWRHLPRRSSFLHKKKNSDSIRIRANLWFVRKLRTQAFPTSE